MTTETTDTPEPHYERFLIRYPSDTAIESFCASGASLREMKVAHPLAKVEAVEDSRVGEASRS